MRLRRAQVGRSQVAGGQGAGGQVGRRAGRRRDKCGPDAAVRRLVQTSRRTPSLPHPTAVGLPHDTGPVPGHMHVLGHIASSTTCGFYDSGQLSSVRSPSKSTSG